jgi:hypothetical protein
MVFAFTSLAVRKSHTDFDNSLTYNVRCRPLRNHQYLHLHLQCVVFFVALCFCESSLQLFNTFLVIITPFLLVSLFIFLFLFACSFLCTLCLLAVQRVGCCYGPVCLSVCLYISRNCEETERLTKKIFIIKL